MIYTSIFLAGLGGFLFGYNTAVIAGAMLFIKEQFHLTPAMHGWTVSVVLLSAFFAACFSGMISDSIGRKKTILLAALFYIFGCLFAAQAANDFFFIIGRLITGIGIGITSVVVPMYLGEIASSKRRGAIVTVFQLAVTIGVLGAYVANYLFDQQDGWRPMIAWGAAPALLQLILFFLILESPRWLIAQGYQEKAEKVARQLNISNEMVEFKPSEKKTRWSAVVATRELRLVLLIGVLLSFFQQSTGINAVIYFAPQIFQMVGFASNETAIVASVGIGVINVLATILAVWLLDKAGRRILILVGSLGMAISLISMIFAFYTKSEIVDTISLIAIMTYVASFAIGLGPVTWVIISEIYPLAVRGKAMSVALVINWLTNYLVASTFLPLTTWIGTGLTFLLFAAMAVLCFFFVLKVVPETRGKKLGDIQKLYRK